MTVFVGPSIWRQIDVRTSVSIQVAINSSPTGEKVIYAPIWNDALIGRSRSMMCTEFLKTDADVMVIIDDDIVFSPPDFWKIVEGARDTKSIYGGVYVTRSLEPHVTSRFLPDCEVKWVDGPVRRPLEIQYLATGFFAIHRDVLEAMVDARIDDADGGHTVQICELGADRPFYPFFIPFQCVEPTGQRNYLSEDWAFCNAARQLGFKVWMDQSIILQHMGWYPFSVQDLNNPGSAFPSVGIDRAEFEEHHEEQDPLLENLIADIAEWSMEDPGDTRRMVDAAPALTQKLFIEKPENETEEEWYRRDDVGMAYVGDLASWHLRGGVTPLSFAEVFAGKRVLDFGCGIGTFALACARAGADVSVFEPNPIMYEFLQWRAHKLGLDITILSEPIVGEFDVINVWHVFEHLMEPEAKLDELLSMLAPNGVFLTDSGFDDHNTPQHHEHADWAGVLASRGLRAVRPLIYQKAAEPVEAVPV